MRTTLVTSASSAGTAGADERIPGAALTRRELRNLVAESATEIRVIDGVETSIRRARRAPEPSEEQHEQLKELVQDLKAFGRRLSRRRGRRRDLVQGAVEDNERFNGRG